VITTNSYYRDNYCISILGYTKHEMLYKLKQDKAIFDSKSEESEGTR
jgi:hypothetical protein